MPRRPDVVGEVLGGLIGVQGDVRGQGVQVRDQDMTLTPAEDFEVSEPFGNQDTGRHPLVQQSRLR